MPTVLIHSSLVRYFINNYFWIFLTWKSKFFFDLLQLLPSYIRHTICPSVCPVSAQGIPLSSETVKTRDQIKKGYYLVLLLFCYFLHQQAFIFVVDFLLMIFFHWNIHDIFYLYNFLWSKKNGGILQIFFLWGGVGVHIQSYFWLFCQLNDQLVHSLWVTWKF